MHAYDSVLRSRSTGLLLPNRITACIINALRSTLTTAPAFPHADTVHCDCIAYHARPLPPTMPHVNNSASPPAFASHGSCTGHCTCVGLTRTPCKLLWADLNFGSASCTQPCPLTQQARHSPAQNHMNPLLHCTQLLDLTQAPLLWSCSFQRTTTPAHHKFLPVPWCYALQPARDASLLLLLHPHLLLVRWALTHRLPHRPAVLPASARAAITGLVPRLPASRLSRLLLLLLLFKLLLLQLCSPHGLLDRRPRTPIRALALPNSCGPRRRCVGRELGCGRGRRQRRRRQVQGGRAASAAACQPAAVAHNPGVRKQLLGGGPGGGVAREGGVQEVRRLGGEVGEVQDTRADGLRSRERCNTLDTEYRQLWLQSGMVADLN